MLTRSDSSGGADGSACYTYIVLHPRWLAKIALSCALLSACAVSEGSPEEPSSDDEIRALSVTIGGSTDAPTIDDRPRLKPRARGALACDEKLEIDGRVRLTCARGSESLEVILRRSEGEAVLVHRAEGRTSDRRTFFTCSISGTSKLACTKPAPHAGGGEGGLASPFASTVAGIDIPNTHEVGAGGMLLRGMAPRSAQDFDQLLAAGVGAVLIFKNQTGVGSDVADEMTTLRARGLADARVTNIPFKWKDLPGFHEPCTQAVQGLKFIATNLAAGKKTFFHCTVGEDRTGLLAAVHRLVTEPGLDAGAAWDREMCERGYGAGNPEKPAFVIGKLEHGLKPLYRKLAYLVAKGRLRADALDESVCATDPEGAPDFADAALPLDRLACGTSTLFEP